LRSSSTKRLEATKDRAFDLAKEMLPPPTAANYEKARTALRDRVFADLLVFTAGRLEAMTEPPWVAKLPPDELVDGLGEATRLAATLQMRENARQHARLKASIRARAATRAALESAITDENDLAPLSRPARKATRIVLPMTRAATKPSTRPVDR